MYVRVCVCVASITYFGDGELRGIRYFSVDEDRARLGVSATWRSFSHVMAASSVVNDLKSAPDTPFVWSLHSSHDL